MADPMPLTVEVPEPFADEVRAAVATGEYASAEDVVLDALQHWSGLRLDDGQIIALRRIWERGKASGHAGPVDFKEIRAEARQRLAETKAQLDRAG